MPQPRDFRSDEREQLFHFRRVQRAGRFVHDDDSGVLIQRLGDFDELLGADGVLLHRSIDVDLEPQRFERAAGHLPLIVAANEPAPVVGVRPRKMLSATDIAPITDSSWWITATPSDVASRGERGRTSRPSIVSVPEKSVWMPPRMLINVLFPAPFSPASTWTSPGKISNDTSSRTATRPNRFVICDIRASGCASSECSLSFNVAVPLPERIDVVDAMLRCDLALASDNVEIVRLFVVDSLQ